MLSQSSFISMDIASLAWKEVLCFTESFMYFSCISSLLSYIMSHLHFLHDPPLCSILNLLFYPHEPQPNILFFFLLHFQNKCNTLIHWNLSSDLMTSILAKYKQVASFTGIHFSCLSVTQDQRDKVPMSLRTKSFM